MIFILFRGRGRWLMLLLLLSSFLYNLIKNWEWKLNWQIKLKNKSENTKLTLRKDRISCWIFLTFFFIVWRSFQYCSENRWINSMLLNIWYWEKLFNILIWLKTSGGGLLFVDSHISTTFNILSCEHLEHFTTKIKKPPTVKE